MDSRWKPGFPGRAVEQHEPQTRPSLSKLHGYPSTWHRRNGRNDKKDSKQRRWAIRRASPTTGRKGGAHKFLEWTPTEYLTLALRKTGHNGDIPASRASRVDLSWVSPYRAISGHTLQKYKRRSKWARNRPSRVSLQTVLADYIYNVDSVLSKTSEPVVHGSSTFQSRLNEGLESAFSEENLEYLAARGYSVKDLVAWAWILKSERAYQAALRLLILEEEYGMRDGFPVKRVPPFIPLYLLRRQHLDAKTFRLLLLHSLHLMSGQPLPDVHSAIRSVSHDTDIDTEPASQGTDPPIDPTMCMIFVVRLLRHARNVWPQAQFTIARKFASFLTRMRVEGDISSRKVWRRNRFLTHKFNVCLWLLSLPSKPAPFVSASTQQRAQFELLRAMAAHRPVLPVTRQGYRGIIAVQLAHKKTMAERKSAEYKALSWPPWKEGKLGIDSERGNEGLKSRAMRVIYQMREAGYSYGRWEDVAAILAGWDTDQSPTIQTRRLMHYRQASGAAENDRDDPAVWAARIHATRTVREAWACFLAYQDRGLPPRSEIYSAMALKLVFRRKAIENDFDETSLALPGDGPEVFPEPPSARDVIYVRTEPPTLDDLLKQMLSQRIRPSGRFLAFLLESATTFSSGLDYLCSSNLWHQSIKALCTVRSQEDDCQITECLDRLPHYLFSSFIGFLCKFSNFDQVYIARHDLHPADLFPIVMCDAQVSKSKTTLFSYSGAFQSDDISHHPKALAHAVYLMRTRKPRHALPWIRLLSALSVERIKVPGYRMNRSVQRILAWHEVMEVLDWMEEIDVEPGVSGFSVLCPAFTRAVMAGLRDPHAAEEALLIIRQAYHRRGRMPPWSTCRTFEEMVHTGLNVLKSQFDRLVMPGRWTGFLKTEGRGTRRNLGGSQSTIPPMLQTPSPAVLHAFVRALGMAQDYDGLLHLLRWMSRSAQALKEVADELLNGERMMRRTLVAVRVFLEGHWATESLRAVKPGSCHLAEYESSVAGETLSTDKDDGPVFSDSYLQEAYDIIESTELWGSWPTDEEVYVYISWETRPHN